MPADQPSRQLESLQSVTDAALSYLPLDALLDELLTRVRDILDVDTVAILLLDDNQEVLEARAAKGLEEEVERRVRIPVGRGFAGRVASERRPVHIPDVSRADIVNPILREKGLRSLLGVPLLVEGDVVGVLHVGSLGDRVFTEEDAELLQAASDRAALAISSRLTERERGLAEELQRSLLPGSLPGFPGASVAARYTPSGEAVLGGDWYDAFLTGSGMLCAAIGDVVGRGFRAAALMAQLRSALRAYALDDRRPGELVRRLNHLIRQIEPGRSATLVYVVFDPRSGHMEVVSAGNPPPLIISPEGKTHYLEAPPSPPLGAKAFPEYRVVQADLEPGSRLLLYTDGLIEVPSEPLETGLERLRVAARAQADDAQALADEVFDSLLPSGPASDDAALVVLATSALSNPLVMTLAAERESAPLLRRILSRWLSEVGASRDQCDALVLACAEACSNAIEHAYPPDRRDFRVEAREEDGQVTLAVRDWGRWRAPRGENRGRGFMMMKALADSVEIDHGPDGTTVVINHQLRWEDAA